MSLLDDLWGSLPHLTTVLGDVINKEKQRLREIYVSSQHGQVNRSYSRIRNGAAWLPYHRKYPQTLLAVMPGSIITHSEYLQIILFGYYKESRTILY